jgi:hypothetical protein
MALTGVHWLSRIITCSAVHLLAWLQHTSAASISHHHTAHSNRKLRHSSYSPALSSRGSFLVTYVSDVCGCRAGLSCALSSTASQQAAWAAT